ncbi:MAG: dihydroorotate dehydrogenase-like protein [Mangrovibacterium sp.]
MSNLSTRFFGLELKSPVIAASCSMTGKADQILKIARAGAGAIVLKSIFEEEIYVQLQQELSEQRGLQADPEYMDYFDYVIREENLNRQMELIKQVSQSISVPIVASINCSSASEWTSFARRLQDAGADALELNLFAIPSDIGKKSSEADEQFYFGTIARVLEQVSIPVSIKIGHYFSNLAGMIYRLSRSGVAGITLFNRFYAPDIDVAKEQLVSADIFSSDREYLLPLRWTGIMAPKIDCPLAATTGIHSAETALKFLLAGAGAVQVASVLYRKGPEVVGEINQGITDWMNGKGYKRLDDFRGKLSILQKHAVAYERSQFINWTGKTDF